MVKDIKHLDCRDVRAFIKVNMDKSALIEETGPVATPSNCFICGDDFICTGLLLSQVTIDWIIPENPYVTNVLLNLTYIIITNNSSLGEWGNLCKD